VAVAAREALATAGRNTQVWRTPVVEEEGLQLPLVSSLPWVVFDNAAAPVLASPQVFDTLTVTADSGGRSLTTVRARAYFQWATRGDDVVLQY
jgi:hypothetical protein